MTPDNYHRPRYYFLIGFILFLNISAYNNLLIHRYPIALIIIVYQCCVIVYSYDRVRK